MATRPYNPRAYVPGGSSPKVALAIQNLGYATAAKPKKPTTTVVTKTTPQGSFTTIETPAQIEERVRRMADEAFNRQRDALREEADQMRREAEARRRGMAAAYEAAARANAGMGTDVQSGWEQAASTISGLAGTTTGGVRDALAADLATQEQALSRVGAGGTGFDARSQAAVEQYRGGFLPGEYDTRMGGIGRQFLDETAVALNNRGLQEGLAAEAADRSKIDNDLLSQVRQLTTGRTDYETKLREQLLGARGDLIKQEAQARQDLAALSLKKVQIEQAQQKINLQYAELKAKAVTAADKLALDKWYKEQNVILAQARNDISQQRANIAQQNADTAVTRVTTGGANKPPSASTVSNTVKRANDAGAAALAQAIGKITSNMPGMRPPANWDQSTQGRYTDSAEYAAALAAAKEIVGRQYFGTLMARVITTIGPHLKALKWSQRKIKQTAYNIVTAKVDAPEEWLKKNPGFGPRV